MTPAVTPRVELRILGIRGIPGRHGGFESFAEELAPYLVARDWGVTVYCQESGSGPVTESWWRGVRRVHVPVTQPGALGTIAFDWKCTRHAMRTKSLVLVLGYNTAIFTAAYRLLGIPTVMNMDGVEWKRRKYNALQRAWMLLNEQLGRRLADTLIADHPVIAKRLRRSADVPVIPYGAREVRAADAALLAPFGLTPGGYVLVIARPEPENSILEIVRAFGAPTNGMLLVVLGNYRNDVRYERQVLEAASDRVRFPGAVYDHDVVDALRHHARLYVHGHTVGGTNPALVEALGAGAPVLAHDNEYNRWVAGDAAEYFADEAGCAGALERLLRPAAELALERMRAAARRRHASAFTLPHTLERYHQELRRCAGTPAPVARERLRRRAAAIALFGMLCATTVLTACGGGVVSRQTLALPPLTVSPADLEAAAQRLTAGDVVTVSYPYRPEFSRDLVVRPDGRITLPYVGALTAGGRTPEELRLAIQQAYARRAYAPSAQAADRHYLINVGDVLELRFREASELNTTVKVRPDGRISLALVKSVMAEGLTPEQLEAELIKRYRGELTNPDLVVVVQEFTSDRVYVNGRLERPGIKDLDEADVSIKSFVPRQVYVAGEVSRPGLVPYQPGLSALQAIAAAGGVPRTAKMDNVLVLRRAATDSGTAIFVNLAADMKARATNDVLLRPFDVIIVPKTGIARASDFLDQYLYQLLPITRNANFSFFYDLSRSGARIP